MSVPVAASLPDVVSQSSVTGWDAVISGVVLIVAWIVSKLAGRATRRLLDKNESMTAELASIIVRCVRYTILIFGLGVALSLLGAHLQPLLVAVLIIVAVAALAVRGVADNFGAGLILQTRRPIRVGDLIEALGQLGVVSELNSRAVVVATFDGRTVHLPNSEVLDSALVNHSVAGATRTDIQFRIESTDLSVLNEVVDAAGTVDGVRADPAVDVLLIATDEQRLIGAVRVWHDPLIQHQVSSRVVAEVTNRLRGRGVAAAVTSQMPAAPPVPPARI